MGTYACVQDLGGRKEGAGWESGSFTLRIWFIPENTTLLLVLREIVIVLFCHFPNLSTEQAFYKSLFAVKFHF